eukprot:523586-Pelagomonas_calceolata.AAC.5
MTVIGSFKQHELPYGLRAVSWLAKRSHQEQSYTMVNQQQGCLLVNRAPAPIAKLRAVGCST